MESHRPTGKALFDIVRKTQPDTLLAFSTGKDAIAAWLAIREANVFERVFPYYLYSIPGMEFIDESLDYYERFFETRIARLPHPGFYRMLHGMTYQPPERVVVIDQAIAAGLPMHDYRDIHRVVAEDNGLKKGTMAADGVRAADSPMRRIAIMKHGPVSRNSGQYHAVWDWRKADLVAAFKRHGVKLPVDYAIFGRTFDGIDIRFTVPLKKHFPRDYQRLLEWFPLADLDVYRWETANGAK